MNQTDKLDFIFQTGKKIHFYMDGVLPESSDALVSELSNLQVKVAMQVYLNEPLSLSSLAGSLGLSNPSASVLVEKLVEKEVLNRDPDPADRRKIELRVHPKARPFLEEMLKCLHKRFQRLASKVGDENIDKWYQVALKLSEIIEYENAHP